MNRRSMLSFLGIGAVGASTLGAHSGMNPVPSTEAINGYWIDKKETYSTPMVEDRATTLKRIQDDLFGLTSDPAKWIAERAASDIRDYMMGYGGVSYQNIDPDIRNMKSITEAAKMRIYYERRAKRQLESQKESLSNRIAEYLGMT